MDTRYQWPELEDSILNVCEETCARLQEQRQQQQQTTRTSGTSPIEDSRKRRRTHSPQADLSTYGQVDNPTTHSPQALSAAPTVTTSSTPQVPPAPTADSLVSVPRRNSSSSEANKARGVSSSTSTSQASSFRSSNERSQAQKRPIPRSSCQSYGLSPVPSRETKASSARPAKSPTSLDNQSLASLVGQSPAGFDNQSPTSLFDQSPTSLFDQSPVGLVDQSPTSLFDQSPVGLDDRSHPDSEDESQSNPNFHAPPDINDLLQRHGMKQLVGRYYDNAQKQVSVPQHLLPPALVAKIGDILHDLADAKHFLSAKSATQKCIRLQLLTNRTTFKWHKDDKQSAACQTCTNKLEPCMRVEQSSKTLVVVGIAKEFRTKGSSLGIWIRDRREGDGKLTKAGVWV